MRRALLVVVLLAAACGNDDDATTTTTTVTSATTVTTASTDSSTTTSSDVSIEEIAVRLTEIGRFDEPIDLAVDGDGELVIAEKGGRVRRLDGSVVLDLDGEVSTGFEQGLLGIAWSPDGRRFYAHFTNRDGDTRVEEWSGDLDPASRRTVLAVDQPYPNHNGGRIAFGPDGLLYLGLGDGGAGGDPHGNGQDPGSLLGKILRWDPAGDDEPERWAIGVRNPWRFSFDRATGDVWVGDVGQGAWEEIDRIPAGTAAGVNLGWNRYEGSHEFADAGSRDGLLFPVFEYGREAGRSVVGGFVYRGAHDAWQGAYFFSDTYTATLQLLVDDQHRDLGVAVPGGMVSSFGEDADGELYVLSLDGGVFRLEPA